MDLKSINLNLLLTLEALLEERSVTLAGKRMGLSQPAASAALKQLRALFDDELLVRHGGSSMQLTARAEELHGPLRDALRNMAAVLEASRPFDPKRSDAEYRICASDYVSFLLGPNLFPHLQRVAPKLRVRMGPAATSDIGDELARGRFDLAVGALAPMGGDMHWQEIMRDRFICLVRAGHPASDRAENGRMREDDFLRHPQVHIAVHRVVGSLSADLAGDHAPPPTYTVASHLAACLLVLDSDLVAIVSEAVALALRPRLAALGADMPVALELPQPMQPHAVSMLWHTRHQNRPLSRWLREQITTAAQQLTPAT